MFVVFSEALRPFVTEIHVRHGVLLSWLLLLPTVVLVSYMSVPLLLLSDAAATRHRLVQQGDICCHTPLPGVMLQL